MALLDLAQNHPTQLDIVLMIFLHKWLDGRSSLQAKMGMEIKCCK